MKILLKIRAPSSGDLESGVVPYGYSNLKISSLHVFPAFKTLKSHQALHVFSMNIRHFMQTFAIVKNDHCERLVVPSLGFLYIAAATVGLGQGVWGWILQAFDLNRQTEKKPLHP